MFYVSPHRKPFLTGFLKNHSLLSTDLNHFKHRNKYRAVENKMMNLVSLTLVLTSLVTGAVWSPSPHRHNQDLHNPDHRDVIVKEGHRVVVVEFEKEGDDGNTKVLISPHEPSGIDVAGAIHSAGETLSGTPGKAVDAKEKVIDGLSGHRELVCDAFGKCKDKIASVIGASKDKVSEKAHEVSDEVSGKAHDVSEKAHEVSDKVLEKEEHAKEAVGEAIGKARETTKQAAEDLGGGKVSEKLSEKAKMVGEKAKGAHIGEVLGKAKDSIGEALTKSRISEKVKGMVKDTALKTAQFDVVDSPKRIGEDVERNVTGKIEEGVQNIKEQAKETVVNAKEVGSKSFGEILGKLKEVMYDVILYIGVPEKVCPVMGLIHIIGFSTAYGMCVWVTFVSSYILGRALPRQQFGMIQSKIYPVYFRAMAYCVGAALLGHSICQRKLFSNKMVMFQGFNLLSALLMVLANLIFLEPRATKMMFERMKIEKEEGRGLAGAHGSTDDRGDMVGRPTGKGAIAETRDVSRLNENLKKLNAYSSALNVSTLVVLTWHVAYMGQLLQASR